MKKNSITTFVCHIGSFFLPIILNSGCSIFLFLSFIHSFNINTEGRFNLSSLVIASVSVTMAFLITLLISLYFRRKLDNYFITVLLGDIVFLFIIGLKVFNYFNLL